MALLRAALLLLLGCGRIGYEHLSATGDNVDGGRGSGLGNGPFAFGDGHWGALTISEANVVVNPYFVLTEDATAQSNEVRIDIRQGAPRLVPGDLMFFWQPLGLTQSYVGVDATSLAEAGIGHWELRRVQAQNGSALTLREALTHTYDSRFAQVVVVPEYTTLEITALASLRSLAWTGRQGGIVILAVSEEVRLAGTIDVSAQGFRGGVGNLRGGGGSCTNIEEPAPLGARRGESIVADAYGSVSTGRSNRSNGGGGGLCTNAGGAGGGGAGKGGKGGLSYAGDGSRDVGGIAGAGSTPSPSYSRLTFGGGGGAGHVDYDFDRESSGGTGGGVIVLFTPRLAGTGALLASGSPGNDMPEDGGGGGGGGGTIVIESQMLECGRLDAQGGRGGNVGSDHGPGGGGGGGYVVVRQDSPSCVPFFGGGSGGSAGGNARGAESGRNGLLEGF